MPCRQATTGKGQAALRGLALAAALSTWGLPLAHALITTTYPTGNVQRSITLRVGSTGTTIDEVSFDVSNASVAPTQGAITGAGAGPVTVTMTTNQRRTGLQVTTATLTVSSTTGLTCSTASSCDSTIIPFSTISWTASNPQTTGSNAFKDIQSGTFNGSSAQQLAQFSLPKAADMSAQGSNSATTTMTNTLTFQYANTTVYPSGTYKGRVTFTASMT